MTVSPAIAISQRVRQVAEIIGQERMDESEIGTQRSLDEVRLSVDLDALLALLDDRSDAGRCQHAAEP
jgi:hypothetical protein